MTVLKSLADSQKSKQTTGKQSEEEDQYIPDESDSTKTRRLAEDYDSTKNGVTSDKYQGTQQSVLETLGQGGYFRVTLREDVNGKERERDKNVGMRERERENICRSLAAVDKAEKYNVL